jgi:UDP-N-acetylglucosamine 1-carboxyvinyltransferase
MADLIVTLISKKIVQAIHLDLIRISAMSVDAFRITGEKKLKGDIIPQGAKNEALQIISAVLLTDEEVVIQNLPDIVDVNNLIFLLEKMGVAVKRLSPNRCSFTAKDIDIEYLTSKDYYYNASRLRGSVMVLGPLLARYRKAYLPKPGGDKIGRRRLDTHFLGFEKLGARFDYNEHTKIYSIDASKLRGTYILLDEPSVTGTANIIMAAVLAEGETIIYNAACEPYLQQLCKMLNRMGAKIEGVGTNRLHITGVTRLGGTTHTCLPDMIEIGSFIGMAALTQSEITIKDCAIPELGLIPDVFRRLGINIEYRKDDIYIPAQERYEISSFIDGSILTIADGPWPLFTPDLISIALVVAIQAKGSVLIHQKMFESRLFFTDKLIEMGAQIILCDPHRAVVNGLNRDFKLKGIQMTSPDIRAGVALLMAAMCAKGVSTIYNINQIDRGYQNIDTRLNAIGAHIERIQE